MGGWSLFWGIHKHAPTAFWRKTRLLLVGTYSEYIEKKWPNFLFSWRGKLVGILGKNISAGIPFRIYSQPNTSIKWSRFKKIRKHIFILFVIEKNLEIYIYIDIRPSFIFLTNRYDRRLVGAPT